MSGEAVLVVRDLVIDYGRGRAVDRVSLAVPAGACVGLVGANGAGKSSLLRAVAGLTRIQSGSVQFDGKEIAGGRPWQIARMGLRMVPETRELSWGLTVRENLALGTTGLPAHEKDSVVASVLEVFPMLGQMMSRKARLLSGGQQQMLAVGRALAGRPKLLIVDEPSQGLAPNAVSQLIQAITVLRDRGLSIVIADTNLRVIRHLCTEALLLQLGRTVARGAPEEVLNEQAVRVAYLGK